MAASKDRVRGRTALQKISYFAHIIVEEAEPIAFKPHFYGPYSPEVSAALSDLRATDFIQEEADLTEGGNVVYTYTLTSDGRELAETAKQTFSEAFEAVKSIRAICEEDANTNPNILSWAAKTHFLLKIRNKPMTAAEAAALGQDFNWKMSFADAKRGLELLSKLELVKPAPPRDE